MAKYTLAFLGGGKMAEGILSAALAGGMAANEILVAEKLPLRAAELAKRYGVATVTDAIEAVVAADMLILAVRPQDVQELAEGVRAKLSTCKLLVSIVAGKSLSTLRKAFGREVRLVRVMPNLALRAREGMCAICPSLNAKPRDVKKVQSILDGAGRTMVLAEKHFDAVTALSGSGPAFYAFMEQAMVAGGRKLGLPAAAARLLAEQTMLGTAAYLRTSGADLQTFIAGVATPGGTTAAGMEVLVQSTFVETIAATLAAAARRSRELGK